MTKKLRIGVLFGGRSAEHEVSVTSARSMLAAMDTDKYDITMIGIAKDGQWLLAEDAVKVLQAGVVEGADLLPVLLDYPGSKALVSQPQVPANQLHDQQLDVIFPLLHGPYGEDGTIQGLLELTGIAYVGSGVVGSAVGMDKEVARRAFRAEGLPITDAVVVRRRQWRKDPAAARKHIESQLRYPLFVKPVNLGSSVGVSKVREPGELDSAMDEAATYDSKIIVENEVADCREIECAVLGNDEPEASVLGEIVPGNEFYDYATKYIDDKSELIVPARVSDKTMNTVRALSLRAFRAVDAAGLARVDFFVNKDDESIIHLNEINTMPGFTPISMYPRLWQASGVSYPELIDRLIQLALERQQDRLENRTSLQ